MACWSSATGSKWGSTGRRSRLEPIGREAADTQRTEGRVAPSLNRSRAPCTSLKIRTGVIDETYEPPADQRRPRDPAKGERARAASSRAETAVGHREAGVVRALASIVTAPTCRMRSM